jgi:hypothetical protein
MEVYSRDLRAMGSAERKNKYREMERAFVANRPTLAGRIRLYVQHLRARAMMAAGALRKV